MKRKTVAKHKSELRASLTWFSGAKGLPLRGALLRPEWAALMPRLGQKERRLLSAPVRFWSARGVGPEQINEGLVDAFMAYRAEHTAQAAGIGARRALVRAWNRCVGVIEGWPALRLVEPACKPASSGLPWEHFPELTRAGLEECLAKLPKIRKTASGKRCRGCGKATIKMRRARYVAYFRKAISMGIPIEDLSTFPTTLARDVVERVIDAYWLDEEAPPKGYVIDLVAMLASFARQTPDIDPASVDWLEERRAHLLTQRTRGLTEKNYAVVRQVLTEGVWRKVVALPDQLMQDARRCRDRSPVKAAVLAQQACAIGILTLAPVRVGNLAAVELNKNLLQPGGNRTPFWLVFPEHDVKNRVRLEFVLDERLTALIDEYVAHYLPTLKRGHATPRLFPGERGGRKGTATLSAQITKNVWKATGLRITAHQFRHAAAALILRAKPGNYEFVRRILGHKSIQTTIIFYTGLETTQATVEFGNLVRRSLIFGPEGE